MLHDANTIVVPLVNAARANRLIDNRSGFCYSMRIGGRTSSVGRVANLPLGSGFPAEQAGWQPAPRRTCGSHFSADP